MLHITCISVLKRNTIIILSAMTRYLMGVGFDWSKYSDNQTVSDLERTQMYNVPKCANIDLWHI